MVEIARRRCEAGLDLRDLVAQILQLALNVVQGRVQTAHQRVHFAARQAGHETESRPLVRSQLLDDGAYDMAVAVAVLGKDFQEDAQVVLRVGQRFVHLPDHGVGLAGGAVEGNQGGGQAGIVDLIHDIAQKGSLIGLREMQRDCCIICPRPD